MEIIKLKYLLWHMFFAIMLVLIIFVAYSHLSNLDKGYYMIERMWIGSGDGECDECLWIEFYEGCNRYKTYYFEDQHEFDKRLEIGMPVDIEFKKVDGKSYIKGVVPRKQYQGKC